MLFSCYQISPFCAEICHLSEDEKKSWSRKYCVTRTLDLRLTWHFRKLLVLPLFAWFDNKKIINRLHLCESVISREVVHCKVQFSCANAMHSINRKS